MSAPSVSKRRCRAEWVGTHQNLRPWRGRAKAAGRGESGRHRGRERRRRARTLFGPSFATVRSIAVRLQSHLRPGPRPSSSSSSLTSRPYAWRAAGGGLAAWACRGGRGGYRQSLERVERVESGRRTAAEGRLAGTDAPDGPSTHSWVHKEAVEVRRRVSRGRTGRDRGTHEEAASVLLALGARPERPALILRLADDGALDRGLVAPALRSVSSGRTLRLARRRLGPCSRGSGGVCRSRGEATVRGRASRASGVGGTRRTGVVLVLVRAVPRALLGRRERARRATCWRGGRSCWCSSRRAAGIPRRGVAAAPAPSRPSAAALERAARSPAAKVVVVVVVPAGSASGLVAAVAIRACCGGRGRGVSRRRAKRDGRTRDARAGGAPSSPASKSRKYLVTAWGEGSAGLKVSMRKTQARAGGERRGPTRIRMRRSRLPLRKTSLYCAMLSARTSALVCSPSQMSCMRCSVCRRAGRASG